MIRHAEIDDADLRARIRRGEITLGGYDHLRIYGRLDCASGKRMLRQRRVFFRDQAEALAAGYRPCGNCLRADYRAWRAATGVPETSPGPGALAHTAPDSDARPEPAAAATAPDEVFP